MFELTGNKKAELHQTQVKYMFMVSVTKTDATAKVKDFSSQNNRKVPTISKIIKGIQVR